MGFRGGSTTHGTPWEALVGAWREATRCDEREPATLEALAQDCDAATRWVSAQEGDSGLPRVLDLREHPEAEAPEVPFEDEDHITALMEAAEQALGRRSAAGGTG